MPVLKEGEMWNPRFGLGDVAVKGDGVAAFDRGTLYIDVGLIFGGESLAFSGELDPEQAFATLQFTNNAEALESRGYSKEEAEEISKAVDILCKYIDRKITGSKVEYEII